MKDSNQNEAVPNVQGHQEVASEAQRPGANNDAFLGKVPALTPEFVAGLVMDTHHPQRPGRVLVRWLNEHAETQEAWLDVNATINFEPGMQVMLMRPTNWFEWVVSFPFGAVASRSRARLVAGDEEPTRVHQYSSHERLEVVGKDGQRLFRLKQDDAGNAVLELPRDLQMQTKGVFRLQAERVEIRAGDGGADIRSTGETVVRGSKIHLN